MVWGLYIEEELDLFRVYKLSHIVSAPTVVVLWYYRETIGW